MNMKQSCRALICAIEGELDGRHCTEEQAAAILDHALPSLTEALARMEAELAEALGEIQIYQQKFRYIAEGGAFYLSTAAECVRLTSSFLAMHANTAQAEQQEVVRTCSDERPCVNCFADNGHCLGPNPQEAQGAKAGDERAAFEEWLNEIGLSDKRDASGSYLPHEQGLWDAWETRAALATQPAAGEPVATWVALTAAGQLRKGDKIRFRFGQETLTETVALVLDAGTEREEIVYNRKRNFYFITSKALAGTSSAKEVEVLRAVAAPPAAAHGDEAVPADLKARCQEISQWRKTGVLQGAALREYAESRWPGDHSALQMAEHETASEAFQIVAAMRAQGDGGAA